MKMNENQLMKLGDRVFHETFKSMQLLGFTVLYYNFNMNTEKMNEFNDMMHKKNEELLEDCVLYDKQVEKIEKIWGVNLSHIVKNIPYRARVKMMGGLPKKTGDLQAFNMANLQSFSAIESFLVLTFASLMELNRKFGKVQMETFFSNLIYNSENYSKGMTDEFVVKYFINEIGLTLHG